MWGVICADNSDTPVIESLTQGLTITFRLDGWVTLDASAQSVVVTVAEIEMGDGGLGSDI